MLRAVTSQFKNERKCVQGWGKGKGPWGQGVEGEGGGKGREGEGGEGKCQVRRLGE